MKYNNNRNKLDVSIRIINWNTSELLDQCLTSIIQNTDSVSYEILIVDNNSKGMGFTRVKEKFSKYSNITWIENDKNIGGLADNQALQYCQGRYILILGPDTIVLPQALKRMVDFLDKNKEAGAVTAKLLNPDMSPQNYYYKFWNLSMFFFSTMIGRLIDKIFFKDRFRRYYFGGDIDPSKTTIVEQPAGACLMLRWDPPIVDYITNEDFPFYFGDELDNIMFGESSLSSTTYLTYNGSWIEYPTITITGPITNPMIRNITTDEKITLEYEVDTGEYVIIDLTYGNKTVLNDSNINLIGTVTSDSDLSTFHIAPSPEATDGENEIIVSGADIVDGVSEIDIEYYERYLGV